MPVREPTEDGRAERGEPHERLRGAVAVEAVTLNDCRLLTTGLVVSRPPAGGT